MVLVVGKELSTLLSVIIWNQRKIFADNADPLKRCMQTEVRTAEEAAASS